MSNNGCGCPPVGPGCPPCVPLPCCTTTPPCAPCIPGVPPVTCPPNCCDDTNGCPRGYKPCTMSLRPPANCDPRGIWIATIEPCPPK